MASHLRYATCVLRRSATATTHDAQQTTLGIGAQGLGMLLHRLWILATTIGNTRRRGYIGWQRAKASEQFEVVGDTLHAIGAVEPYGLGLELRHILHKLLYRATRGE